VAQRTRLIVFAALSLPAIVTGQSPAARYDVILRHGIILDGTGAPRYRADVAVAGGSIARIGDLARAHADIDIDVTGLFVAPGFLNIHSHATPDGLMTAVNMLTQGVTSEIVNADGAGPLDVNDQLTTASERGLAVNVGAEIGFNSVWASVIGLADRRAAPEDIARMRNLITDGLTAGAWGVSAGLDYKPAYFAQTEEVISVVDGARSWRTHFTNHDRVTPESGFSSLAGMAETLAIGERSGTTPVITHMKVQGHEQGRADVILGQMRQATQRGSYTAADVYPYLAGQTGLVAFTIPGWAQDGGREAMLKRFGDPVLRARIVKEAEAAMTARFGGAASVYLPESRQELTTVMHDMDVPAGEAVVRLLERSDPSIIARFGGEADLVKILQYPASAIACDCGAVVHDAAHPRFYGTFPRVLGRYTRDQHVLTWEDAVRKMTGLPAAMIGIVDRGLLAAGMAADITVFDPVTITDHATFDSPMLPSDGVRYVLVNGRLALRDGRPTGERAGQALRRSIHMPSRPMNAGEKRTAARRVTDGQDAVVIDVKQEPGAHNASGTFRLTQKRAGVALDMSEFGQLQTAREWASFTGRARLRPAEGERSVTVIVDADQIFVAAGDFECRGSPPLKTRAYTGLREAKAARNPDTCLGRGRSGTRGGQGNRQKSSSGHVVVQCGSCPQVPPNRRGRCSMEFVITTGRRGSPKQMFTDTTQGSKTPDYFADTRLRSSSPRCWTTTSCEASRSSRRPSR
jgi:N-acyl-D-aspartate/D-glutamate deacylase